MKKKAVFLRKWVREPSQQDVEKQQEESKKEGRRGMRREIKEEKKGRNGR